ncbi:glycoside hydrolase family 16 protein [Streptomyces sp. AM2-3-1]|uniref:glycoside hydrolase family 16 protein n=1 Tax=Streptomyces sp. AM2-3-1 TaxID=3075824 RepID=UPI0028C3FCC1|nr:glycoside hydrolase family 16 protein [Streptomyces sp. AM2-3-1]WNO68822.1 glycoside hydrolase family 16 protein [Streptomyces sp. AM2-3-1]
MQRRKVRSVRRTAPSALRIRTSAATAVLLAAMLVVPSATPAHAAGFVDPQTPAGVRPNGGSSHATLVFSDEFYGTSLDSSKWSSVDSKRRDGQYFDSWWKPSNVKANPNPDSVNGGNLWISLSKLSDTEYATGEIEGRGKFEFTYGTVEWRAEMPPNNDLFGALWLMPPGGVNSVDGTARDGGEYDVIESTSASDSYGNTIHYDGYGTDHQVSSVSVDAPGLHSGYHTYTVEWRPDRIIYRYDSTIVRDITDPKLISQVPMFPVVSSESAEWAAGSIYDAALDYRSNMYVDYIRVWQ